MNEDRLHFYHPTNPNDGKYNGGNNYNTWNDLANNDAYVKAYVVEYVPEPASLALLGLVVPFVIRRRRQRKRDS